jgi:pimeloyl-ACP methyl ester carboxylesterase
MGHSMGGKTAMLFAVNYPELLASLIVVDISPRFYPIHHDAILEGLSSLNFDQISSRKEADVQLSSYVADAGTRMFLLKNLYRLKDNTYGLRINLKVLAEHVAEVGEALPLNTVFNKKTLFLRGDKSEYIMPADTSLINAHFPLAEIETISNAGHWLHAENPVDFCEKVFDFLNG